MFDRWMTKNESISADLKEIVFVAGIKYGSLTEWEYSWNIYNSTTIPSERKLFLRALGAASDPWILQRYYYIYDIKICYLYWLRRYLLETVDRSNVKSQDIKIVLGVVAENPEGRLLAWRHLKAYWPTMYSLFGNSTFMMGSLISAVTAHLSTPYDYYEVRNLLNISDNSWNVVIRGFSRQRKINELFSQTEVIYWKTLW